MTNAGERRSARVAMCLAFAAGAAGMLVEIAVARMLGPVVGMTQDSWAALIGTVLAGTAIGAFAGGLIVDRIRPKLVAVIVALGAAAYLLVLPAWLPLVLPDLEGMTRNIALASLIGLVALPPSVAIGALTPIAVRIAFASESTGRALGRTYAAGVVGAIAGTFAAGFVLIQNVGVLGTIMAAALLLAGSAAIALVGLDRRRWGAGALVMVGATVVSASGMRLGPGSLGVPCLIESAYTCIQIDTHPDGFIQLMLDRVVQGHVLPSNPSVLKNEYMRGFARADAILAAAGRWPVEGPNAFVIGGGAFVYPRFLLTRYPTARVTISEIDPRVIDVGRQYLGLSDDARMAILNEDARMVFARARAGSYDAVYGDAFSDFAVPYHLTTREFAGLVRQSLKPRGAYILNVIDIQDGGRFMRSFVRTLGSEFNSVTAVAIAPAGYQRPIRDWPGNFILIATQEPLTPAQLTALADQGAEVLTLTDLALDAPDTALLTDDYAPTDMLLRPLMRR